MPLNAHQSAWPWRISNGFVTAKGHLPEVFQSKHRLIRLFHAQTLIRSQFTHLLHFPGRPSNLH